MSKGVMIMGTARGKIGEMVMYRAKGEQRTRTYVKKISNPKTRSQMEQRTQLNNLLVLYRSMKPLLFKAFSDKDAKQSDYNAFVGKNLNKVKIYTPKYMAAAQGGVVAPYQISSGNYPPIIVSGTGVGSITNIAVTGGFEITAATTVAEFSEAVIKANASIQASDQLSYVSVIQSNNPQTGYPVVSTELFEVTLSLTDNTLIRSYLPAYGVSIVNGFIGHGDLVASGAFAWILSRKNSGGALSVSPQRLIVTSEALYSSYTTPEAIETATRSYNSQSDAFLTPGTSSSSPVAQVMSVSSLSIAGSILKNNAAGFYNWPANNAIQIAGGYLDPSKISILTSTTIVAGAGAIVDAAVPLADFMSVTSSSDTLISGTITAAGASIRQIAIVGNDRVLLNIISDGEEENPLG